mmetsp:Transcript_93823/g.242905  ORF Transcript_93823/g.242905 Transcript_93823/m.242905 type:complete len:251 (-) Transcript_93823:26-778(-)
MFFQAPEVDDQLVLLLDDAPVVHAVEVALLPELVPGLLGSLRYLPGLLHLIPEHDHLLVQAMVPGVDVRNDLELRILELTGLLELVPLRLEGVEAPFHAIFDQEIPEKVVDDLWPLLDLGRPVSCGSHLRPVRGFCLRQQSVDVVERLLVIVDELRLVGQLLVGELIVAFIRKLDCLQDGVALVLLSCTRGLATARHGGTPRSCAAQARAGQASPNQAKASNCLTDLPLASSAARACAPNSETGRPELFG